MLPVGFSTRRISATLCAIIPMYAAIPAPCASRAASMTANVVGSRSFRRAR